MDETVLSLFGSLFHPDWRESEAQLTEKQAVLLMHDIYRRVNVMIHDSSTQSINNFPKFQALHMDAMMMFVLQSGS